MADNIVHLVTNIFDIAAKQEKLVQNVRVAAEDGRVQQRRVILEPRLLVDDGSMSGTGSTYIRDAMHACVANDKGLDNIGVAGSSSDKKR